MKMKTTISTIACLCLCACTAPTQQTQIPPPPIISYTAPTGPAYMKITERIVYRGIADDDIIDHINYLKQVPNNALEVALFTIIWGGKKQKPTRPTKSGIRPIGNHNRKPHQ